MAQLAKQKRTTGVIRSDSVANSNVQTIALEIKKIFVLAALIILAASAVNYFVQSYLLNHDPNEVLLDSGILILLGAVCFILSRIKMKPLLAEHLLSALCTAAYLFIAFRFYTMIGISVWILGFALLAAGMGRGSSVMLIYSSVSLCVAGLMMAIIYPNTTFSEGALYYIIQLCVVAAMLSVCAAVHHMHVQRRKTAEMQMEEMNRQIKERKKAEEESVRLALYDQLTGLPNRTLLYDRLNQALLYARRNELETYVLFLDLDYFKIINDTLGHMYGDEIIRQVGKRLSGLLRKSDTVARIGGDEFVMVLQNVNKPLNSFAQTILKSIHMPYMVKKQQLFITCSIGIATFSKDGEDAETLIKHADMAMYKAKSEGKNRYAFFSEDLKITANYEMELITSLQFALKRNELQLFYQPQVDCSTGKIVGVEALMRWNHPKLGQMQPMEFIAAAERAGLMLPLGEWVMRTACKQNKAWQDEGLIKVPIAVNVSIKQFENNELIKQVKMVLKETGLEAKYLELELKERIVIKEMEKIKSQLETLKKLGVTISVDDFGTGYSTFHYLSQLPVERIKIPMDFIKGIDNNLKDESIITVIIALADNMHLGIVAEGVETKKQLEFLEKRFCKNMQGYYFSKPMPAVEIKRYMEDQRVKIS
jgi:diguanylate cyclase (GGDEF)-like protein